MSNLDPKPALSLASVSALAAGSAAPLNRSSWGARGAQVVRQWVWCPPHLFCALVRAHQKQTLEVLLYSGAGSDFCRTAHAARVSANLACVSLAREPWGRRGNRGCVSQREPKKLSPAKTSAVPVPLRLPRLQTICYHAVAAGKECRGGFGHPSEKAARARAMWRARGQFEACARGQNTQSPRSCAFAARKHVVWHATVGWRRGVERGTQAV